MNFLKEYKKNLKLNEYIERIDSIEEDGIRAKRTRQKDETLSIELFFFYEKEPFSYIEGKDFQDIIKEANKNLIDIIKNGLFFTSNTIGNRELTELYSQDLYKMLRSHYNYIKENQQEEALREEAKLFEDTLKEYRKNLHTMKNLLKEDEDEEEIFQILKRNLQPIQRGGKIDPKEYEKPGLLIVQEIDERRKFLPYYEAPSQTIDKIEKDLLLIVR